MNNINKIYKDVYSKSWSTYHPVTGEYQGQMTIEKLLKGAKIKKEKKK